MTRPLTRKEEAFVMERTKDKTASNAEIARRAGYAPKNVDVNAHFVSTRPEVMERIQSLGEVGLDALERRAKRSKNEIAQVQAAKTLVETAYGRPKDNPTNQFGDITINVLHV